MPIKIEQQFSKFFNKFSKLIKHFFRTNHASLNQPKINSVYREIIQNTFYPKTSEKPIIENVFLTSGGVLVFYHLKLANHIKVYSLLFEVAHPKKLLWKSPRLVIEFPNKNQQWKFINLEKIEGYYQAHWQSPTLGTHIKVYPSYRFKQEIALKFPLPILEKSKHNPMIKPSKKNSWETLNTFNPAAFYAADKVHLLYRAQGRDYISKIGYATSKDGLTIDTRLPNPVFQATKSFEGANLPPGNPNSPHVSGGGCGGIEDPRTTIIDDRLYMTYVAYNGWSNPRIALTSILLSDFLNHNFLWEKPVLISEPGITDKNACIFPEKINNKYVIMHRVFPNILIDYVDDLNFNNKQFLKGEHKIEPRSRDWWDSRKIGAGAPPVKTDEGWLLIYQAVDDKDDSEYKIGAMLLDLNNPSKVLYRSQQPILLPREDYENYGFKAGVVYPCGLVIIKDTLFVYYGGADSYVCVAVANLQNFIHDLKNTGIIHLDKTMLQMSKNK